jgi:hypothetical protein
VLPIVPGVTRSGPHVSRSSASAGPEYRSVHHGGGRIEVASENPVRHPGRRPTHREIPNWQKHEARTRKLAGGRVSRRTANQASSVRRIAQIPHEGRSVVDGAPADVAKGVRMGGRDNHATSLGQSDDADESGQPGHWRHANWPMKRISTSIPALQQVRLEGSGRAVPS